VHRGTLNSNQLPLNQEQLGCNSFTMSKGFIYLRWKHLWTSYLHQILPTS